MHKDTHFFVRYATVRLICLLAEQVLFLTRWWTNVNENSRWRIPFSLSCCAKQKRQSNYEEFEYDVSVSLWLVCGNCPHHTDGWKTKIMTEISITQFSLPTEDMHFWFTSQAQFLSSSQYSVPPSLSHSLFLIPHQSSTADAFIKNAEK